MGGLYQGRLSKGGDNWARFQSRRRKSPGKEFGEWVMVGKQKGHFGQMEPQIYIEWKSSVCLGQILKLKALKCWRTRRLLSSPGDFCEGNYYRKDLFDSWGKEPRALLLPRKVFICILFLEKDKLSDLSRIYLYNLNILFWDNFRLAEELQK